MSLRRKAASWARLFAGECWDGFCSELASTPLKPSSGIWKELEIPEGAKGGGFCAEDDEESQALFS